MRKAVVVFLVLVRWSARASVGVASMEAKYDEGFNFLHYDVDAVTAIARMPFDRSVNCSFLPRPPACNF